MQQQALGFMLSCSIHRNDRIVGNLLIPHCPTCEGERTIGRVYVVEDDPTIIRYLRCKTCNTSIPHESDIRDLTHLKPV